MLSRQPYSGLSRKLVLAFDVGTTYSGISYCLLDPGEVPKVQGVARYPAQEHVGGDSKIPSILYYDNHGAVRAIGAEALQEHIIEQAEEEGWTRLEWWKLHLRAKHLAASHITDGDIPPLPKGKTGVQVLGDFMRYLFQCAQSYIEETHANGANLWKSVGNSIEFVLTHPNGWEGPQQSQIRRAAVLAGLIPDTTAGQSRVQLVTEGEASLHFCVANVLASDTLSGIPIVESPAHEGGVASDGKGVIIVDAGGGTIDLSAYSMSLSSSLFEEIAPTQCRLQGSVFVTRRAHALLKKKLDGSLYGNPDIIEQMIGIFDKTTKLRFRNAEDPSYIKFGTVRDKDPKCDIRSGQLKLQGQEVATLFEPSVQGILEAIEQQRKVAQIPISFVFLVGGFAASDWLFASLQAHLQPLGINFCRPDSHVNKAVADGAVSFHVDHLVHKRVARYTYGLSCNVAYDTTNPEHLARRKTAYHRPSGRLMLPNAFSPILTKETRVSECQEFQREYCRQLLSYHECTEVEVEIMSYRGADHEPRWTDTDPKSFSTLCSVRADTSLLAKSLQPRLAKTKGSVYYEMEFSVILLFGLTELAAQVSWTEDGVNKRSPAVVVYDEEVEEA
ncbi:hypothetical protein BV22DRAFT_1080689 [Leucogyrophana mollusca]|uniref:Uncharacterized protein n=1 Tax=Leucogyrophana mollusca TaxID=85980 RepID=A0ACB8BUY4_9AGAM|nr:hypothetical protein BV22DRAFT_1080689 [Leucogyrophana mollusca]